MSVTSSIASTSPTATSLPPRPPLPPHLLCGSGERERDAFRSRCGGRIDELTSQRRGWLGKRGLLVIWEPALKNVNLVGLGHMLPLLYHIHAMCFRVERACNVRLFDSMLQTYFGYADDTTWGIHSPRRLQRLYGEEPTHVKVLCNRSAASSMTGGCLSELERSIAGQQEKRLVVATVDGVMPFFAAQHRYTIAKVVSHAGLGKDDEALYHRGYPLTVPPTPASLHRMPTVDPCLCRFVTEPRKEIKPTRRLAGYRTHRGSTPRTAVHLRTGFADASDALVQAVGADEAHADQLLSAACSGNENDVFTRADHVTVVSDSPGLLRLLRRRHPGRIFGRATAADATRMASRSWLAPIAVKHAAMDDVVALGLSTTLYVAPQRRLTPRPSARLTPDGGLQASSFYAAAVMRSMCVQQVGLGVPGCDAFPDVFPRDLLIRLEPAQRGQPTSRQLARPMAFNVSLVVNSARRQNEWRRIREHALGREHPCKPANVTMGECVRRLVAGLK